MISYKNKRKFATVIVYSKLKRKNGVASLDVLLIIIVQFKQVYTICW